MVEIKEYINVKNRAQDLDCDVPESIAILPRNFENANSKDELSHESTTSTIRILWRQNHIIETPIEKQGEKIPFIIEESFGWVGPVIFVASAFLTQNPHLINIALGVISNYLTDWFKGIRDQDRNTSLDIVIETKSGSYKRVHYEGPPEGLEKLPEVIRSVHNE